MGWSGEVDGTVQVRWGCTGRAVGVKGIWAGNLVYTVWGLLGFGEWARLVLQ
nr:hypothetical protein [Tanacetum cinerariifolium]